MRDELFLEIETLQALYYLCQSVTPGNREHVAMLRDLAARLPNHRIPELLIELREEISQFKQLSGCLLSDENMRALLKQMTARGEGYVYVPKFAIDRFWFRTYQTVFPRWPHVPLHALVMFDTRLDNDSPYSLWLAESQLFRDVKTLWVHARRILSDGKDFRTRPTDEHLDLHSYLRTTATAIYHFLEAYLNGTGFGCFQMFHNELELEDHDLLAEWDSKNKCQRFVSFERKLRDYPAICGKYLHKKIDLRADPDFSFLTNEGKLLRDSLTHPSPYVNFDTNDPGKIARIITIQPDQVRQLLESTVSYVRKIEEALGRDPGLSTPWLELDF